MLLAFLQKAHDRITRLPPTGKLIFAGFAKINGVPYVSKVFTLIRLV
jgi:hypothetical protein